MISSIGCSRTSPNNSAIGISSRVRRSSSTAGKRKGRDSCTVERGHKKRPTGSSVEVTSGSRSKTRCLIRFPVRANPCARATSRTSASSRIGPCAASTESASTYNHIKGTLEASDTPYADKEFSVFLQGSYGNDTNIYAESDVDVVIKLETTFQHDLSALTESEKAAFHNTYDGATYTYIDFNHDVQSVLTDAYGDGVKAGKKAIAIPAGNGRRKTDVIVAIEYRRYIRFDGTYNQDYVEGIVFYTSSNEKIVNFPKTHSKNLTTKHQSTDKWLKPMTRVLKNMRSRMVDDGTLEHGDAPSYYLEGLLYNIPDGKFGASYGNSFCEAINWLEDAEKSKLVCANEQYYLLRTGSHVCWNPSDCNKFLSAVSKLWNDW